MDRPTVAGFVLLGDGGQRRGILLRWQASTANSMKVTIADGNTLHERKTLLQEMAHAFIALPGGCIRAQPPTSLHWVAGGLPVGLAGRARGTRYLSSCARSSSA